MSEQDGHAAETPEERRRRRKREANARWMAKPENREKYNRRLAEARATPEGRERKRAAMARWLAGRRSAGVPVPDPLVE